jgi:4-amino-4-deoxy-L-arabinose transferase-like glycosyltransferase
VPRPVPLLEKTRELARRVRSGGTLYMGVIAAAATYIAAFVGTGALRAVYPYPIDGIEPGSLQVVERILNGQAIYGPPALDFVPMIYGPLYFFAAALVAVVTGSDLLGLRIVAWLSSLGSIALIALLVRYETGSIGIALVGSGLLAACAPLVLGAMDVGRTDATSLLFLLASVYVARRGVRSKANHRSAVLSGALMGCALLTKASGLPVALVLLAMYSVLRREQILAFVIATVVVTGIGLVPLVMQSGSWPIYYMWVLPRQHEIILELVPRFWEHVMERFTVPILIGPFYLLSRALARDRTAVVFYGLVTMGMLAMAWASQATIGGGRNVELPALAAFSMLGALALREILQHLDSMSTYNRAARAYVLAATIAQFAILIYNPRLTVPYRSDLWDGDRLTATLGALPGPIFAGSYGGYLRAAPDAVAPSLPAVLEIEGEVIRGNTPEGDQWDGAFATALKERRFTNVIVDPDSDVFVVPRLAEQYGYQYAGPLFPPGDKYWEWRTGWAPKADVYVRRE